MTYIPGTGKFAENDSEKLSKADTEEEKVSLEVFSAVNVKDLKKPEDTEDIENEDLWYLQLKNWVLMGSSLSVFFAILSITNWRFLFLLPLGPYAAYLSWHIRKKIKRYAKRLDVI
jgi:hypothetical protein